MHKAARAILFLLILWPFSTFCSVVVEDTRIKPSGIIAPPDYSYISSMLVMFYTIPVVRKAFIDDYSKFPSFSEASSGVAVVATKLKEMSSSSHPVVIDESVIRSLESEVFMKLVDQSIDMHQFIEFFLSNQPYDIVKLFQSVHQSFNAFTGKNTKNTLSCVINAKFSNNNGKLVCNIDNSHSDGYSRIGNVLIISGPNILVLRVLKCPIMAAHVEYASAETLEIEPEILVNRNLYSFAGCVDYTVDTKIHSATIQDFESKRFYLYDSNGNVRDVSSSFSFDLEFSKSRFTKVLFYVKRSKIYPPASAPIVTNRSREESPPFILKEGTSNSFLKDALKEKWNSIYKPVRETYLFPESRYDDAIDYLSKNLNHLPAFKLDIISKKHFGSFVLGSQPYSFQKSIRLKKSFEALEMLLTIIISNREAIEFVLLSGKSSSAPLINQILAEILAKMLLGIQLIPIDTLAFEICRRARLNENSLFPSENHPGNLTTILKVIIENLEPNLFNGIQKVAVEYSGFDSDDPISIKSENPFTPLLSHECIVPRQNRIEGVWTDISFDQNRRRLIYKATSIFLPIPVTRIYTTLFGQKAAKSTVYWNSMDYHLAGSMAFLATVQNSKKSSFVVRSKVIDNHFCSFFQPGQMNQLTDGRGPVVEHFDKTFANQESFYVFFVKAPKSQSLAPMTSDSIPEEVYDRIIDSLV